MHQRISVFHFQGITRSSFRLPDCMLPHLHRTASSLPPASSSKTSSCRHESTKLLNYRLCWCDRIDLQSCFLHPFQADVFTVAAKIKALAFYVGAQYVGVSQRLGSHRTSCMGPFYVQPALQTSQIPNWNESETWKPLLTSPKDPNSHSATTMF